MVVGGAAGVGAPTVDADVIALGTDGVAVGAAVTAAALEGLGEVAIGTTGAAPGRAPATVERLDGPVYKTIPMPATRRAHAATKTPTTAARVTAGLAAAPGVINWRSACLSAALRGLSESARSYCEIALCLLPARSYRMPSSE
jgi:hypothetical protein